MIKLMHSKLFWVFVVLIAASVIYWQSRPQQQSEYVTAPVTRGQLLQTVSVTGSVQAASEIDLSFEVAGILAELKVAKGDRVQKGAMLARLQSSTRLNAVQEARANLQAAVARLQKLLAGASEEDIAVSEQKVKSAQITYEIKSQELENLRNKLAADEQSYNDAVNNKEIDIINYHDNALTTMSNELFSGEAALNKINDILEDNDKIKTLGVKLLGTKDAAQENVSLGFSVIDQAKIQVTQAQTTKSEDDLLAAFSATLSALTQVADALSTAYTMLLKTPAGFEYTQTEITTDKDGITSDQTTVSASIVNVQNARTNYNNAKAALSTAQNNLSTFLANKTSQLTTAQGALDSARQEWELAKAQLSLKKALARPEDIALQQAEVAKARAALAQAQTNLDQVTIYAPMDGMITKVNNEVGEKIDPTSPVISMIGESGLEIEVDIPESDIPKVVIGQKAVITLDAFGEDTKFSGQVTFIDPAETVIQDVVYYRVTVTFDAIEGKAVKPGMTANIDITTAQKENVLLIPARAVKDNKGKYVEVLITGQPIKKEVMTGLKGDAGLIEIVSGLEEGEEVITFKK